MASLPRFRSALRRILPGPDHARLRAQIRHTAETFAKRSGATPDGLRSRIAQAHSGRLKPAQLDDLARALERDLPREERDAG